MYILKFVVLRLEIVSWHDLIWYAARSLENKTQSRYLNQFRIGRDTDWILICSESGMTIIGLFSKASFEKRTCHGFSFKC